MRILSVCLLVLAGSLWFCLSVRGNEFNTQYNGALPAVPALQQNFLCDDTDYEDLVDQMDKQGLLEPKKESRFMGYVQVIGCYCAVRYMDFKEKCSLLLSRMRAWLQWRKTRSGGVDIR